jgi:hypothetical protein
VNPPASATPPVGETTAADASHLPQNLLGPAAPGPADTAVSAATEVPAAPAQTPTPATPASDPLNLFGGLP